MTYRAPHGGGILISLPLAIGMWALLFAACATPAEVRPFPLDPSYTERFADPGEVDDHCYNPTGHHDNGLRTRWDDNYCGCVDWASKTVWIARRIDCDIDKVRLHEGCHLATGTSKAARAMCDKEFRG